jgi:uncharacterized protein YndB with AHSA1/START domain
MAPSDTPESEAERTLEVARVLSAPRALVWRVLTDRRHVSFFWGPDGFSTTTTEMDVRPGGDWRFTMHGPDGTDYINHIRYETVQEPAFLAWDHYGADPDVLHHQGRIELTEEGPDKTRVTLRIICESKARLEEVKKLGAEAGGHQTLARLDQRISDAETDMGLSRIVKAPRALVWRAWTDPALLRQWWCPRPWMVADCRLDLRAGGELYTLMQGPAGEEVAVHGCFLEVCDQEKLVWTELMTAGFRPVPTPPFGFVAVVTLEDWGNRTRYSVRAMHTSPQSRQQHEEMGFYDGWATVLEQLADLVEGIEAP